MLAKLRVQHYKSLFDTTVDLEPLTVFIGPNGSGKSNICETLAVLSDLLQRLINDSINQTVTTFFTDSLMMSINRNPQSLNAKFWHGKSDFLVFEVFPAETGFYGLKFLLNYLEQKISIEYSPNGSSSSSLNTSILRQFLVDHRFSESPLPNALRRVNIYDFAPIDLSQNAPSNSMEMERTGKGIAYALVDILHSNRKGFDELEARLRQLVPNIQGISLPRGANNQIFSVELIDKYSEHHIPASDISDGTLRILAFLTALYQQDTPSIICFEELENGVHPWLLHKMMELLKIVSTEGINGKPVQVLITTHSPVLLNYVEPYQVRAVELDSEGKTQVHKLPIDSVRFQKALEAYDGDLGELWFTNVFGGNPA